MLWQLSREGAEDLDEVCMCMRRRMNFVITALSEKWPEGAGPAGSSGSQWAVGPILLSQTHSRGSCDISQAIALPAGTPALDFGKGPKKTVLGPG